MRYSKYDLLCIKSGCIIKYWQLSYNEKGVKMNTNTISDEASGFSAKMALCLAAITLVGIDGQFEEKELDKLRTLIHTDETAFLKAFNFYNDHPFEVCMKIVSARLNEEQKRITYCVLFDIAHSDQDFAKSEEDLLKKYAAAFELKDDFISSVKTSVSHECNLAAFE